MTDHRPSSPAGAPDPGGFDSEIDVRRILEVGAWLAAITVVSLIIGYFLYRGLGRWADRSDPARSPLPEASRPVEPPAPRLQTNPELELRDLRRAAEAHLGSWGWVDRSAGIAHIPIELAIASLAVPEPPVAAPAAATPAPPAAEPTHAADSGH